MKHIRECDEVWHAGDIGSSELCREIENLKPFKAVYGNIDDQTIREMYPEDLIFSSEEVKVYITHIGGYPGKYPARIKKKLMEHQPKLFICGHSHILKVIFDKELDLLHVNPGACGQQGFHQQKTAVKFTITGNNITNMSIIELGKRNQI